MPQLIENQSVPVGTTSVELSEAPHTRRNWIQITNTSTGGQVGSINPGEVPAVAGTGIVLAAGAIFTLAADQFAVCWQGPIQIIASAPGATFAVSECREVR